MKVSLIFLFILILNVFSITRIYYYDKCDSSFTSFLDAIKSVGIPKNILYIRSIAKLNSIQKEDFIYLEDYYPWKVYFDPEIENYLLNLLKNGKLISYVDNYLPIEDIKRNFESIDDFYETKNIFLIMCKYFLENSYMKTPFIAAVLGILDYTKNFGKLQFYGEKSEYVGKIVSEISLKELKELNPNNYRIGCLEWKEEDAKKLIQLYLEESKGSDKLNMDQIALAEAKMIVYDLINNKDRKYHYDLWNNINEFKHERYSGHPAWSYAESFTHLYSCRVWCPNQNTIDKIYEIMTIPQDNSEEKKKIIELKEKVYNITKDLFGVEIIYTNELEIAPIKLLYIDISAKIFNDIKINKKGLINYIIENNEIKSLDFSFNNDMIDIILNKIKDALKGKFEIVSIKDLNKKMEKSRYIANFYLNYIFPNTLEYIIIFSTKVNGNTEYDSGVKFIITFNQNNLCKEIIDNLIKENMFSEALSKAMAFFQDGIEKVLEFLKDNYGNIYSLLNLLLILICLGLAAVTGGAFPVPI